MYKSVLYKGKELLGEVDIYSGDENNEKKKKMVMDDLREIRISHFSQPSERCPPLAVLHTVACGGEIVFKMESKTSLSQDSPIFLLHSSCVMENKTAVMSLGAGEELHLVAMFSRNSNKQYPCFWGFNVASGLYQSCLVMLNLRCLGIVFDLDETLIVANTMRSFEDRIESLQRKISNETDSQRIAGMLAEVKRYQDDKSILKQFVENDQVVDNGRVIKAQSEVVPALSDNHQPIVRPLVRLQEKNIILTRINPQIRDTSVLVRLRPAWEDLRSYLTARGRKRFEVYVCTMAERDYALEMWRLLDPESNLINFKELLERIVCVKSGLKKSLFNVFQDGLCHPRMALVIDDRLKVWDEKDQPRVHVVPAFAPYYSPQAEANNAVPVLCVARNVACNVRGSFFKEFDDCLLQKIPEISYEDDIKDIPSAPDVSNFLVTEDDGSASNGNRDSGVFDGMADAEVERRLKEAISAASSAINLDPRLVSQPQYSMPSSSVIIPQLVNQVSAASFSNTQFPPSALVAKPYASSVESSLQSSPAREEGEVPESELDPDTRRRLLILQHGQDVRENGPPEPQMPARPQIPAPVPPVQQQQQQRAGWFPVEEEMSPPRQPNRVVPKDFSLDSQSIQIDKRRSPHPSYFPKVENSVLPDRMIQENRRLPREVLHRDDILHRDDRLRFRHPLPGYNSFQEDFSAGRPSSSNRDREFESGPPTSNAETPTAVLQEIGMKCGARVEFRPALIACTDLQFSVEAWVAGEKMGDGTGRTRREAQLQAADLSLRNLADIYISRLKADSGTSVADTSKLPDVNDNGFVNNYNSFGGQSKDDPLSISNASEQSRFLGSYPESSKRSFMSSVSALEEYCAMEGLHLDFHHQPPSLASSLQMDEVLAQVEIDGQLIAKGIGLTWDEAKMRAAEKALGSLRAPYGQKRHGSPRSMQGYSNKRLKQHDFSRVLQRVPSSARYPKNAPPVP